MSAQAHALPAGRAARRPAGTTVAPAPAAALSRREATLRAAATVSLTVIALVQAIELPCLFAQGGQFALLSMAAMAVCTAVGVALTAAPAEAAGPLWRLVAATAVVVLAGWALPRAFTVPGLEPDGYGGAAVVDALHRWASPGGAACAVPAVVCLAAAGLARVTGRPARPAARTVAAVLAVLVVLGPGAWVAVVALGPGAVGGEQSLAQGHVHSHAGHAAGVIPEAIEYRRGSGRAGGHYLVAVTAPARQTPLALGLIGVAALVFGAGAVDHLRRRSAPRGPVARFVPEGGPA